MGFFIIFTIFVAVILLFSSKKFSPIPYFPSQPVDLPKIIKALNLKNNQTVIDLGAGDGIVIFRAAQEAYMQKLNTKFVGVDINPILILVMNIRRLFHPNRKNIKIVLDNIFKMDLNVIARSETTKQSQKKRLLRFARNDITFYLYISPWFLEKVIENCKSQIDNFKVISYMYPVKSLKNKEKVIKGKNSIFVYDF